MMVSNTLTIILVVLGGILSLISLGGGIFCIVRYFQTRKIALLIVGLILTFILPGICLCLVVLSFIPSTMVVYGPPPNLNP